MLSSSIGGQRLIETVPAILGVGYVYTHAAAIRPVYEMDSRQDYCLCLDKLGQALKLHAREWWVSARWFSGARALLPLKCVGEPGAFYTGSEFDRLDVQGVGLGLWR